MVAVPINNRIDSHVAPESVSHLSVRDRLIKLFQTIRTRDSLTCDHSRRVSRYAYHLALAMGFARDHARDYAIAGLIHDLGKIWIVDAILNKESILTPNEYAIIKEHVNVGARIIAGFDLPQFFVDAAKYHHESFNGSGYPEGLLGHNIPQVARLLAVVDTFDVITSTRTYKLAQSEEIALQNLERDAGTLLDPLMTKVFIDLARKHPAFVVAPRIPDLHIPHGQRHIATEF